MLKTCGDWHTSAIQWERPHIRESEGSFFGNYGIEENKTIPEHNGKYNVANHIRALLDLLEDGNYAEAQGMNEDFICNPEYNDEVFALVYSMRRLPNWKQISDFMVREYKMKWIDFLREKYNEQI